ncbi:MAG: hypothetical protein IJY41_02005 [Clostridia bacterium]|nr:hypothetical protein [Clostridia bacterium]
MSNNIKRPFPIMRIALMAVFSILLLFGSTASLTYALFHNELANNVAKVQAGDLEISAEYVKIEGTKINTDPTSQYYGRFISFSGDLNSVLTEQTNNIFDIESAAPTMTQTATFKVGNEGSVAFDCEVRICDLKLSGTDAAADEALSKQMLIRIDYGTEHVEFRLADYEAADSSLVFGSLSPDDECTFTVTATFLNDEDFLNDGDHNNDFDNMDAIGGSLSFDITIIATQSYEIANP